MSVIFLSFLPFLILEIKKVMHSESLRFWTRYVISLGGWCCLWLNHFWGRWFRYWWYLINFGQGQGTRIGATYLHVTKWLFRGFSCETQVSAVPVIHPSIVSDNLVWAYTNLFVNCCWGPLLTIFGGMDTNGVPWFKRPEFLSAIVVIEGLFVLLGMKKLGSGVKFGLP